MTISPHGVSTSLGTTGARVTYSSRGRVTRTVGIPGTGVSYVTTTSTRSASHAPSQAAGSHRALPAPAPAVPAMPAAPHPGLFAPRWQKALAKALPGATYDSLHALAVSYPEAGQVCMLLGTFLTQGPEALGEARSLLENLWSSGWDPAGDEFVRTYLAGQERTVRLAPGVAATLPLGRMLIGLALAETRQAQGDLPGAAAVVESLEPSTVAAVSLADLYAAQHRWQDLVDLTTGVEGRDDFSIFLLTQRGIAFRELGYPEAARESFRAALARRSAPPELRHHALVERALTYENEHKLAPARRDLERVLADDPAYPGLAELLADLDQAGSGAGSMATPGWASSAPSE